MKLIHCSDLHLDAAMRTNLDADHAKERKGELLETFARMIEYAETHDVRAILICGDLFDSKRISVRARQFVAEEIKNHPDILFFYLKGNHDADGFLDALSEIPDNLKTFDETWTSYALPYDEDDALDPERKLTVAGIELSEVNAATVSDSLILSPTDKNIVMMHGQTADYPSKEKAETVDLGSLRSKNIDYLALGHIHEFRQGELFPRGIWCYSGCLEGRGYDECGPKGFVLLDVTPERIESEFVPFAKRRIYEVPVDVSDGAGASDALNKTTEAIEAAGCEAKDYVKVTLTGAVDPETEIDSAQIVRRFEDRFYAFKIKDETTTRIDIEAFAHDASLKGEFIRLVWEQEDLDEQQKGAVIRMGLSALSGEEMDV